MTRNISAESRGAQNQDGSPTSTPTQISSQSCLVSLGHGSGLVPRTGRGVRGVDKNCIELGDFELNLGTATGQ